MSLASFNRLLGVALVVHKITVSCAEDTWDSMNETTNETANETALLERARAAYSEQAAIDLSYIVSASYCDGLEDWSCGIACSHVSPVEEAKVLQEPATGVQVLVGKRNDACVVAFSGTLTLAGWAHNTRGPDLKPKPDCYHEGEQCRVSWSFQRQYDSIRPQLQDTFRDLGCHTFDITGHSVGGAQALLLAWDLAVQGYNLRHLYTFGAPRVGDQVFADNFGTTLGSANFFRVTRGDDFVVLIPFMQHGFVHAGLEAYYKHNLADGLHICASESKDKTCARSAAWRYLTNILSCVNQNWCGHHLYMYTSKVGVMGKGSCTATTATAASILP